MASYATTSNAIPARLPRQALATIRSSRILAMMPGILKMGIHTLAGTPDYTFTHAIQP